MFSENLCQKFRYFTGKFFGKNLDYEISDQNKDVSTVIILRNYYRNSVEIRFVFLFSRKVKEKLNRKVHSKY